MKDKKFSYKQALYNLPLPLDCIRLIKEFIGEFPKPIKIRNYENYQHKPRVRHRSWSF